MPRTIGEAIVVRVVDYAEADRVATLLLRSQGKVSALARGARRSRKRYGGLELFACGEATLREGRGELWALEDFDVARGFPHLPLEVSRVAQAAYACEVTRELMPPHHAEPAAYDLLRELLSRLDAGLAEGPLAPAHLRVFELALLDALGFGPVLDRCVACGAALDGDDARSEERHLDVRRGGVSCEHCSAGHGPGERPLRDSALRLLLRARALPLAAAGRLLDEPAPREAWDGAREALQALLREHLGRPLRSVEFIAKLNAAAP
jgi:DNA repair protein RecO (recombination protein O)